MYPWADGGAGTEALAHEVAALADKGQASFAPLYPDEMPIWDKIKLWLLDCIVLMTLLLTKNYDRKFVTSKKVAMAPCLFV